MGEIKSALERALERADKLGELSKEESDRLKYAPIGNILATKYLTEESCDIKAELIKYKGNQAIKYIVDGIQETLLRNIFLPRNDQDMKINNKAMQGFQLIKENEKQLSVILRQISTLFEYYNQAVQQSYAQLKSHFEAQLQSANTAMEQQAGRRVNIDVERHPQFQEAWLKTSSQLNAQYEKALQEQKEKILELA